MMKRWIVLVSIFFTPLCFANSWTLDAMMQVKLIDAATLSSDGTKVAYLVEQYTKQNDRWHGSHELFLTDKSNHQTKQLTTDGDIENPDFSPNDKYLAYIAISDDAWKINVIDIENFQTKTVVSSKRQISLLHWSPDSKNLAYVLANPTAAKIANAPIEPILIASKKSCSNIWLANLDSAKTQQITHYDLNGHCDDIAGLTFAPNSQKLVYSYLPSDQDATWAFGKIAEINLANNLNSELFKQKDLVEHNPVFSPDGKYLAFISDENVYAARTNGGEAYALAKTPDQAPIKIIGWDKQHNLYILEDYHTYSSIIKLSADGKSEAPIGPKNILIKTISMNDNNSRFVFTEEDSNHPEEIYESAIFPFHPEKMTNINADIAKYPLPKTEVIHWRSKDGLEIEGLLTYPMNYQPGKSYPLIVELHGGPGDLFQQRFVGRRSVYPIAIFAAENYAYLRPNIRGSNGYGHKFRSKNHDDWGGHDYQDVITGVNFLEKKGIADPKRLAIIGWSYGGFLTAYSISHTTRFKAAIMGGAIINLISYAGQTDLPDFLPNSLGGPFWKKPELYLQRSPIMSVEKITTPTLILNGELDYRVPYQQGLELYSALKRRNIPTKMYLFPGTYHSIEIPELIYDAAKINNDWLNKYAH